MKLKCVIVDDEPLAIKIIENYLFQIKETQVMATFFNALDTMDYLRNNPVDLLFLDINMPILDGIDFIKSMDKRPMIIITTASTKYAVESYELSVLDYLVKPIPLPRFLKAVNKAITAGKSIQETPLPSKDHIFLRIDKKEMKKVYLDDILIIESLKDYIKILTKNNKYIIHQSLGAFTASLPSRRFLRIHRSYTIALDKVDAIVGNSLEIQGIKYTIGRSYLKQTKEAILPETDENP